MLKMLSKILLFIAGFTLLFLFFHTKPSIATCCVVDDCDPDEETIHDTCPRSGLACSWTETTATCHDTECITYLNCHTTASDCFIRDPEPPEIPPPGEECYPVQQGDYCSTPSQTTYITVKWSWVSGIGGEAACDFADCFFCPRENPPIECEHEDMACPRG